jgi:hypothetical protein
MDRIPAVAGWHWIKHGFTLFRRQPAELSTLFMLCCCLKLVLTIVPVIGVLVSFFILVPAFSQVFMVACDNIERGQRALPRTLFDVFRGPALKRLAGLGAFYLLAFLIAGLITSLLDGGNLLQVFHDHAGDPNAIATMTPDSPEENQLAGSLFLWMIIYQLLTLPLWFAGPLIAWRDMSIGKAIFFSFFSVLRSLKAFIVYALGWFVIVTTIGMTVDVILAVLQIDNINIAMLIMMPICLVLTIITYCAYYASYMQVFGAPESTQT